MSRNEKLSQGGVGGQHSPKNANANGSGSIGGQHSPKDPQAATDKGLNSGARKGTATSHGDSTHKNK